MPKKATTRTPAPTAEWVRALYDLRKSDGDEVDLRANIVAVRDLVAGKHAVDIPKQYQLITTAFRTPFPRDALARIAAALVAKPPIEHIDPIGTNADDRSATSIAERWDAACMEALNRLSGSDVVYESGRAVVRDGESVIKVVLKPDAWANFPRREKSETADDYTRRVDTAKRGRVPLPFAWRVIDRLSTVWGNGEYGDEWVVEFGEYPKPYLGRRYQMVLNADGRLIDPARTLGGLPSPEGLGTSATGVSTKIEYWDADWWAVVIDGDMAPGYPKPNPYTPRLPYFRARGADSESMLLGLLQIVPHLDRLLTMKENHTYLNAFPTPVLDNVAGALNAIAELPGGDATTRAPLEMHSGRLFEVPWGKVLRYLEAPAVGADLNQLISLLIGMLDVAGIPSVMRGVGGNDQAGYAINQLMAAASQAFKVATAQLGRQMESVFEFIHWLIAHRIGQTVYVLGSDGEGRRWLGLKPEGNITSMEAPVDALGPISWTFRPQLPTDEQARAMVALQLTNAARPLLDRRTALETYMQQEDPDSILDAIWAEEAMQTEPLKSRMLEEAARRAGLLPMQQSGLVGVNGQPIQSNGQPPTPGVTGIPGQVSAGMPMQPGLNMPYGPPMPGRPAGAYPGMPNTPISQ